MGCQVWNVMKKHSLIPFGLLLAIYAPGRRSIFVLGAEIAAFDENRRSQPGPDWNHHVDVEDEATPSLCRVAITFSGHIQSLVHPVVHRSIRRNLIGAIEDDGCQVDVFAYATRGDEVSRSKQAQNSDFMSGAGEVDAALAYLAPTRLVWHQDQAGIIPNDCPEELASTSPLSFDSRTPTYYGNRSADTSTDSWGASWWQEDRTQETSRNLYWRLYESLAAFRMAQKEEEKGRFVYDWIVHAQFDTAWIRPLPSLSSFSRQAVWFGTHHWPISDHFALVPRALADSFFLAITAFYACDGASWPPAESWWQPGCHGTGFEESVIFRYLHIAKVPYRLYPMFEYVVHGGDRRSMCDSASTAYSTACTLLGLWDGLQPGFSSSNCIATLAEWSNLRCQTLFFTKDTPGDTRRADAIVDPDPSAWEKIVADTPTGDWPTTIAATPAATSTQEPPPIKFFGKEEAMLAGAAEEEEKRTRTEPFTEGALSSPLLFPRGSLPAHVETMRSKLRTLGDGVLLSPAAIFEDMGVLGSNFEENNREGRMSSNRRRWGGMDRLPPWSVFSPKGCPLAEPQYNGRAPHLVVHYTAGPRLLRELGLAIQCLTHRLAGRATAGAREGVTVGKTLCDRIRPLERVMVEIALHSEELGVCTADGSLGLDALEHVKAFFDDPMEHCVGYGKLASTTSIATTSSSPEVAEEQAQKARGGANISTSVGILSVTTERPAQHTGGSPATAAIASMELEVMAAGAGKTSAHEAKALISGPKALMPVSLPAHGSNAPGGDLHNARLVETADAWQDDELSTASLGPSNCLPLSVREMTVVHPKEGAVYWEGPVDVALVASLAGPGVQGLDPQKVHICADIEFAWPVENWSRTCVSLQDLFAMSALSFSNFPPHGFLPILDTRNWMAGVVTGSVSIWDARPECIPPGSLRGDVLPMTGGDDQGDIASKRIRFKIIHHTSSLERRGRPLGPGPLGRGFATTAGFLAELEREAEDEASAAFEEMESYTNGSRGMRVHLRGDRCESRLDMQSRGPSLFTSGFHIQSVVEQLDWMLASGKLPPAMAVASDRMRELQATFPDASSPDFYTPRILGEAWRGVAPIFQKFLAIPAPVKERVVSAVPLQTWEYDEIPWMEALNPEVDWHAIEEAYLGNEQVGLVYVDNFFSPKALAILLDVARGSTFFMDTRKNYMGAYPSDGMSHPLLYQIAEEAAERLPRIVGRDTSGWPLVQSWMYMYGGNDGERCTRGIRAHADTAMINLNIWLAPDAANLGSAETGDGGGLTVFHAKPPDDWNFYDFNQDPQAADIFLQGFDAGNTSVAHKQNRALLFDSMLFHQSDPFRFKKGFENRRLNLTLLFGARKKPPPKGDEKYESSAETESATEAGAMTKTAERMPGVWYNQLQAMQEVSPQDARQLRYCI